MRLYYFFVLISLVCGFNLKAIASVSSKGMDPFLFEKLVSDRIDYIFNPSAFHPPLPPGEFRPREESISKGVRDCETLVHYLQTGQGAFYPEREYKTYKIDPTSTNHTPYSGYCVKLPNSLVSRATHGFWNGCTHYYVYLGNSKYLSKNGRGPIRYFESFLDMINEDAFPLNRGPLRYVNEKGQPTSAIKEAVFGESVIFTRNDYTFSLQEYQQALASSS